MRIAVLSKEYLPYIYGGAGVHVEYLSRELANLEQGSHEVQVLCFGDQEQGNAGLHVKGVQADYAFPAYDPRHKKVFQPLFKNMIMAGELDPPDIVHCHTWYTHFAGCMVKELFDIPLVLTTHSLEPHRPWKAEQLGRGYNLSTWLEKTAYQNADGVVAVSHAMQEDVKDLYSVDEDKIEVIHNGIDPDEYKPTMDSEVLHEYGIDPESPYVLFVGRITRQKGIVHLLRAIEHLLPGVQVVLCAASPDTEEIAAEMQTLIGRARTLEDKKVLWIEDPVPKEKIIPLYSQAAVFVCPSVYEPFGIINLEAMACATPVVASAVGGIPEIVVPEETGLLVYFAPCSEENHEPKKPQAFSKDLARAVNRILADPGLQKQMGERARLRVQEKFSWSNIARSTLDFYRQLIAKKAE